MIAPDQMLEHAEKPVPSRRVLIVDDDRTSRQTLLRLVNTYGYESLTESSGGQALLLLNREPVDLVLMDVLLPDIDGLAVTATIRELEESGSRRRIPIVAITSLTNPDQREACLAAGSDDYLMKPIVSDQLLSVLGKLLPLK